MQGSVIQRQPVSCFSPPGIAPYYGIVAAVVAGVLAVGGHGVVGISGGVGGHCWCW